MRELEFNRDNSQIGFRLQYMELLNWGTFHDKIWRIEPNGNNSLLTGSIGSGKSTLVDALTCLIVPHHTINFNKAANAEKKERNFIS
ncbi:MAG: AAA family ATPase [Deltaproteobacteria bacterium]|nr:AAA family ATPase [Deltaproteobacteria bacterium]